MQVLFADDGAFRVLDRSTGRWRFIPYPGHHYASIYPWQDEQPIVSWEGNDYRMNVRKGTFTKLPPISRSSARKDLEMRGIRILHSNLIGWARSLRMGYLVVSADRRYLASEATLGKQRGNDEAERKAVGGSLSESVYYERHGYRVWNLKSGHSVLRDTGIFDPYGIHLLGFNYRSDLLIYAVEKGQLLLCRHKDWRIAKSIDCEQAALSVDRRFVITYGRTGAFQLLDAGTLKKVWQTKG